MVALAWVSVVGEYQTYGLVPRIFASSLSLVLLLSSLMLLLLLISIILLIVTMMLLLDLWW